MQLTSTAFPDGGVIPQRYGRDFENMNPPLTISEVPNETRSLMLIVEDPDIPAAVGVPVWDHWIVFNIPPDTTSIPEGWRPTGVRGKGTRGELGYGGPRPPNAEHRYFFRAFALNTKLDLPEGATKQQVLNASEGHILAQAELMGRFAPPATD